LRSSRLHSQLAVALAIAFAIIAFVAQPLTAASGVAPLTLVKQTWATLKPSMRSSPWIIFDGRRGHSNLRTRLPMFFDRSKFGQRQTDPRGERR
jgi:hypothetical protein